MDWQSHEAERDHLPEPRPHDETVRAQVADLTETVERQLSEITAEMNRIRAASDEANIGDIQAELDALRARLTLDARGAAAAAQSARGGLDGVHDSAQMDRSRFGLTTSIVIVILMLGGPLWPLTARAIASFATEEQTPWYDEVVSS
jgi:hypothetical protein